MDGKPVAAVTSEVGGPNITEDVLSEEEEECLDSFVSFTESVENQPAVGESELVEEDSRRQLNTCTRFEDNPRDPGTNVRIQPEPWIDDPRVCKLRVTYSDIGTRVCSGSLVGPFHLVTARHCSFNACSNDASPTVEVSCGYGIVEGTNDFEHFGTAFVTECIRYRSYDDAASCENGENRNGDGRVGDIQICRLDRRVGDQTGSFGYTRRELSDVQVRGYPGRGRDGNLLPFFPDANNQQFGRDAPVTSASDFVYTLKNAWVFGGESGGPYLDGGDRVGAVHSGGPTGCAENGTRVNENFFDIINAVRGRPSPEDFTWDDPGDYCQVVNHPVDLFDLSQGGMIGLAPAGTPVSGTTVETLTVRAGSLFQARVSLHNVGNIGATVRVRFFSGSGTSALDDNTISIGANRIFRNIRNLRASWGTGCRNIRAVWEARPSCFTNNGVSTIIGRVCISPPPTSSKKGGKGKVR